jgi:GDP-4-dehydro-6-deoxy-D-mannose reductase
MPRRVAVTGASGFVGQWLMRHLDDLGVDAVSFFPPGIQGLGDVPLIRKTLKDLQPDCVVHLAAVAAPVQAQRDPRGAFDINLTGTLNLAESILACSPHTRLLFAGSSEAYGRSFNNSSGGVTESVSLEPASLYGVTKASADLLLGQMAGDGLDVVRFRPFNHTGPGQTEAYVVSAFARQIARIENGQQPPVIEVGNLDAERDFLDVRDVVRAYGLAALFPKPLPQGIAINLASGVPRKISSILETLMAMSQGPITIIQDPARMRASDVARAVGDASLARSLLGWSPITPFEATLQDVLDYWRHANRSC